MHIPHRLTSLGLGVLAALATVVSAAGPAAADAGPPPSSMASLGDSISRGFNACGWYVDCQARSWSTGDDSGVNSHYRRILAKSSAISGHNNNDARSGAKATDMAGQAATAVGQRVGYVTMLIGGNDACTPSESTMTSVVAFRASLDATLRTLKSGLPGARVELVSIPDVKRLWAAGKGNWAALTVWGLFGICQSLLANPTSTAPTDEARRARVRQRVIDFNAQLSDACAAYGPNCAYDHGAVFNYPFTLSQISTWDYFHPNAAGQQILAQQSYVNGFNW